MRASRSFGSVHSQASRRGLALVVVLFAVLFVSFLVVLFLSLASRDRTGTSAYAESLKSDELTQGGLELVLEELRNEIKDSSRSTSHKDPSGNGPTVYVPKEAKFAVPERTVDDSLKNLLKVSRRQTALYEQGTPLASAAATTTLSRNGRNVSLERWRKPALAAFDDAAATPDWIYFTRKGPVANPTLPAAADAKSANFVTGRVAFAIYDVGGTLDVNVAGYPSELPAKDAGRKGSAALARLQALGLTDAQIEAIVAFRNPKTRSGYPESSSTFKDYIQNENHEGFTRTIAGDNRFLSRQELIRFAEREGFSDKLDKLGIFSREKNAPSYTPPSDASPATAPPSINANLATARHAASGRLLFEKRFPLNKLKLFENPSANRDEIKKHFGLEYQSRNIFTYVGQGSSRANKIKTLNEIASEGEYRRPDFFEILKAVIQAGSLGANPGVTAAQPEFTDADYQIIQIGANIIDQYDENSLPTAIEFSAANGDRPIWGIENLPYLQKIGVMGETATPGAVGGANANDGPTFRFRLAAELWNPHLFKKPTSPPVGGQPRSFRITIGPSSAQGKVDIYPNFDAVDHPSKSVGNWTNLAQTVTFGENDVLNAAYANYNYFCDPISVRLGPATEGALSPVPPAEATNYRSAHFYTNGIYAQLEVFDNGVWYPYQRTPLIDEVLPTSQNAYSPGTLRGASNFFTPDPRTSRLGWYIGNFRPQPNGVSSPSWPTNMVPNLRTAWSVRPDLPGTNNGAPVTDGVLPTLFSTSIPPYLGMLWENANITTAADPDGIVRRGDGSYVGASSSAMPATAASTAPMDASYSREVPSRPIILNRPFQSVGELGYAFRDLPWKTLNFSSTDSADAGLLDVFSLEDTDYVSGKPSLNTPHPEVIQALLESSIVREDPASFLAQAPATTVAENLVAFTQNTEPLMNPGELTTKVPSPNLFGALTGDASIIKTQRESVMRALSGSTQTRTWTLMIDLIAQSGRFPANAANLDDFIVESERRAWLHVAIDRYTGEIQELLEYVTE